MNNTRQKNCNTTTSQADDTVDVPILDKKKAQLMDLNDFSVFELDIPEERKEAIKQGDEVDYFEITGIKTLKELK